MNIKQNTSGMFLLAAILAVGIATMSMSTVFADDESYEIKQKIKIEQDCDQKNENEDSPNAELVNAQSCETTAYNLNDIVVVPPEELEEE